VKNYALKEEILEADPFIKNDVDASSWSDGDEMLASTNEIANIFDA
jgi:hypothetical protein